MDQRIDVFAHYHEPLAFYQRRGGWFADAEAHHERMYSQGTVEKVAALGATTVVWPGYKGLGPKHERVEWERLKPFRRLLERAGLELGVYLQCGSYYAETFYEEHPAAREWTSIDYWGKPQIYSPAYRCYWRHRPCLTHREFSEYTASIARMLVNDYGVAYFNCDNNAQMPCYTDHFRRAFHEFLEAKYCTDTPEGMALFTRRYGHSNVRGVVLPSGLPNYPLESLHTLPDPGLQDWVEFRCRLVARNCQTITTAVKEANPKVRLSYNLAWDYGEFHQLVWGTEPEFVAPHADLIFSEDGNSARIEPDGRLISQVHTCKHLRAMDRRGNLYPAHSAQDEAGRNRLTLSLMELAVHNQGCLGAVYLNDFDSSASDPRPATIGFIRRHEGLFTNNAAVSEIAVLRSRHSGTINWLEATEARLLAQQALYQAGLQWDNVIESNLDQLGRYRLLILPETISMPDACIRKIGEYVRDGGRVVAVGGALSCNEWGCRRSKASVMELFAESDAGYGLSGASQYATAVLAAWLGLDDGSASRILAFPRLVHPNPCRWDPLDPRPLHYNSKYHALPVNGADFVATVRRALHPGPVVEVAPASQVVIPTLLRSRREGRVSLHVLNYRPEQPAGPLTIRVRLGELRPLAGAELISLESERPQPLSLRREDDGISLTLPTLKLYAGVLFKNDA